MRKALEDEINGFIMERKSRDPRRSSGKGRPRVKDKPDEEVVSSQARLRQAVGIEANLPSHYAACHGQRQLHQVPLHAP